MESLVTEETEIPEDTEGSGMWHSRTIKRTKRPYAMCVLFVEARSASKKFQTLHFRNDNRFDTIPAARENPSVFSVFSVSSVTKPARTDVGRHLR
jgi:hypothetical protein